MAWQLVYTSAPALLEAGRTGFGTVAKHEAIRPTLQTEIERISQFSREQGLSKNRILFYHRALDLRGERYHVLTRIKDAGSDYTGRTNHIAHHIVLTASEADQAYRATRCTPADMILWITSNGLWRDQWNEAARLFDDSEQIAVGGIPARLSLPAATWGSVTGSAANAAILAPGGSATDGCWLLYREDQASQLLPLIGESLCLNPNPWGISFSSDTQPTDRIEEIQWRGVALGSPLEREALHSVRPVIDLGNPALLPQPVDAYANLAATGLKKAPEPAIASRKPIPTGEEIKGHSVASTAPMIRRSTGGTVSLKEKMKRHEASTNPAKGKIPVAWIAMCVGIFSLMAIIVTVWNACIFDRKSGLQSLKQPTDRVVINMGASPITDAWWNQLITDNEELKISDYSLMTWGFNAEVSQAAKVLSDLAQSGGTPAFQQNFKNAKGANYTGLLGKIISQISLEKEAADNKRAVIIARKENDRKSKEATAKATPNPALAKKEQTISLKIAGNSLSSGQSITATNGQKLPLEAISSSGTQVSVTASGAGSVMEKKILTINEMGSITLKLSAPETENIKAAETNIQINITLPAARITQIDFYDKRIQPWDYFFANARTNTNGFLIGWSYCQTNGLATNMLALLAVPFTAVSHEEFKTNYPVHKDHFNNNATNPGSCFLKKDNVTQEITLTITADKNEQVVSALGFDPIVLENSGGHFNCTISTNLSPLLDLFKDPECRKSYEVSGSFKGESFKGESLEALNNQINNTIREYEELVCQKQANLDAPQQTNSLEASINPTKSQESEALNKAGEILSTGLTFISETPDEKQGFPEVLKSYSNWLQSKKGKKRDINTYQEYLEAVFTKISTCKNGISFGEISTGGWLNTTKHPPELFKRIISKDISNGGIILQAAQLPKEKNANDTAFIQNVSIFFIKDNQDKLNQFLEPPKPTPTPKDYRKELKDAEDERNKFIEELANCRRSRILIKGVNKTPILIFTSP